MPCRFALLPFLFLFINYTAGLAHTGFYDTVYLPDIATGVWRISASGWWRISAVLLCQA
jgi:hypothetical protein